MDEIISKRKPNNWIVFLQDQATKNKTSYATELANKNNKELYKKNGIKPKTDKNIINQKLKTTNKKNVKSGEPLENVTEIKLAKLPKLKEIVMI